MFVLAWRVDSARLAVGRVATSTGRRLCTAPTTRLSKSVASVRLADRAQRNTIDKDFFFFFFLSLSSSVLRDDYLECLHYGKLGVRQKAVAEEFARQRRAAKPKAAAVDVNDDNLYPRLYQQMRK